MTRQGELYWLDLGVPFGSEPGYLRPYVVVQSDTFNRSPIRTAIVCAVTSNLRLADAPGNVRIEAGEGNLPRASVVNVSQITTVDRRRLTRPIGQLPRDRLRQIIAGVRLVTRLSDED